MVSRERSIQTKEPNLNPSYFKRHVSCWESTKREPQASGPSQMDNQKGIFKTLIKMLAIATEQQKDWDDHLPYISMAYRATPQASTDFSPNFLMFGRELSMPIDVMIPVSREPAVSSNEFAQDMRKRLGYAYELARKTLKRSVERQKRLYNQRTFGEPLETGDVVWCMDKTKKKGKSPKLQPKWKGPGLITQKFNDVIVRVQFSPKKASILHVDMLKPCTSKKLPFWMRRMKKKS